MQKITIILIAVAAMLCGTNAQADQFERQRREAREAAARREQQARNSSLGHWGGPTTQGRWYPTDGTLSRRDIQVGPVHPFAYPNYGFYGCPPYYGFPGYYGYGPFFPAGQYIHIHREIIIRP